MMLMALGCLSFLLGGCNRRLRLDRSRRPNAFYQRTLQAERLGFGLRRAGKARRGIDGHILTGCYLEGKDRLLLPVKHLTAHGNRQVTLKIPLPVGCLVTM